MSKYSSVDYERVIRFCKTAGGCRAVAFLKFQPLEADESTGFSGIIGMKKRGKRTISGNAQSLTIRIINSII